MTELRQRKTKLILETADEIHEAGQYRSVVVELHPMHLEIRLKRMRKTYKVPYSSVWAMAVKAEVERERREKKARKGGKLWQKTR